MTITKQSKNSIATIELSDEQRAAIERIQSSAFLKEQQIPARLRSKISDSEKNKLAEQK